MFMPNSLSELHTLHAWEDNQITERCTQGEYAGKVLQFKLVDKDGTINLSNCLVQYAVTRPDKTEDLLDCTVDNGIVKCNLTYSVTSVVGLVHGEVRVIGSNDSGIIKFYGVNLRVYKGVSDEAAEQSDEFTALIAALQKVVSIIPDPDSENTYVVRLDDSIVQNGLNPVASGVIYDYLTNYMQYKNLGDSYVNDNNNHLDSNTVYKYGTGFLIQAKSTNTETQYYFAGDGKLRYRTRTKTGDTWDNWADVSQFSVFETKDNKTTTIDNTSTNQQYPSAKAVYDTTIRFATITSTDLFNPDTHLDPQTIYRYGSQGLIIPSNSSSQETQYYFAQDGVLRYRYRIKSGDTWGDWVDGNNFYSIINQETLEKNLFPYISPQNKLDKYFVKTCIDKSKIKLNKYTQILGFGDSIMATSDGGSWLDILQEKVGCPAPYNYAIGNAHFSNNSYNGTRLITKLNAFFTDVDNQTKDASKINLIIVAGGTNDAKNGTPINTFKTDVNAFFTSLVSGFESRNIECPPVLVITPIRRGTTTEINEKSENNLEIKIAKYAAILNNSALQKGFSVLNGFDVPILVDDMTIEVGSNSTSITSFMLSDGQHVHPNSTTGRSTYAQAVIDVIGVEALDDSISPNGTKPVEGKVIYDYLVDKQIENDKRFELQSTFGFDENGIPVFTSNNTSFSAGACSVESVKTLFIASNVMAINGGAFNTTANQNITTVYIDNEQTDITIQSGAFPSGATIYYKGQFNALGFVIDALKNLSTSKLDDANNSVKTNHIADLNVTEGKLSSELQTKINRTTGVYSYAIPASNWSNNAQSLNLSSVYTVTSKTKVDIEADDTALNQLSIDDCEGIYVENNNGTLTIKAITNSPTENITVQLVVYEVETLS
jgi:lysophospholipase L1-like esterase